MRSSSFPLWTLALVLFHLPDVHSQISVLYNSNLLTYSSNWDPPNVFGGCPPGYRSCSKQGASVQMTFNGSSVQANVLVDDAGAEAQILVDGNLLSNTSTLANVVAFQACQTLSIGPFPVTGGQHTIELVNNRGSNTSIVAIYFLGFTYTPFTPPLSTSPSLPSSATSSPSTPLSTSTPSTTKSNNNTGAIVGGTIGGIALIAATAFLVTWLIRTRKTSPSSKPDLLQETEHPSSSSFLTPGTQTWGASSPYDISQNAQPVTGSKSRNQQMFYTPAISRESFGVLNSASVRDSELPSGQSEYLAESQSRVKLVSVPNSDEGGSAYAQLPPYQA